MTDRFPITRADVLAGKFEKYRKYNLIESFHTNNFTIDYEIISCLDINLIINENLNLHDLPFLSYISERVSVKKNNYIQIYDCPKLKTLPSNLLVNNGLYFHGYQHLITILSEEQFDSLRLFAYSGQTISSYKEYYSLIEPTLYKNNLLNVCSL